MFSIGKSTVSEFDFQNEFDFERRAFESKKISAKYPDRVPIICEVLNSQRDKWSLDKKKYLTPADLTVGQFVYVIRKRMKLLPEEAIFVFTEQNAPPTTSKLLSVLHSECKNEDGFLYLHIGTENTFG